MLASEASYCDEEQIHHHLTPASSLQPQRPSQYDSTGILQSHPTTPRVTLTCASPVRQTARGRGCGCGTGPSCDVIRPGGIRPLAGLRSIGSGRRRTKSTPNTQRLPVLKKVETCQGRLPRAFSRRRGPR